VRKLEGNGPLWELSIDVRIILKQIFKKKFVDIDCIDVAQHRDRWRAVVHTVMNLWLP